MSCLSFSKLKLLDVPLSCLEALYQSWTPALYNHQHFEKILVPLSNINVGNYATNNWNSQAVSYSITAKAQCCFIS